MNPNVIELVNSDPSVVCCFCNRHEINSVEWGPMYKLDDITLHYFCMLFSCGLKQDGEDDQGVLGFLPKDIRKEVSRGRKLKCRFCRKSTATVGCIVSKCKASFHYPCGLENGTLHQFQNDFASYCAAHKPKQRIPRSAEWVCPICMGSVEKEIEAVWPPCCGKSVFHRSCIMNAAKQAGYFFKCPLCNCTKEFLDTMKANGVYVPEQDAAWETTPGAFAELMEHYTNCDAERCLCPQGRKHDDNDDKNWKIIRCSGCGASAIHVTCGDLRVYNWKCSTCDNVLKTITERKGVSSDGIPPAAAGASGQDSDSEETSSESESESSEESEASESSDSDEAVRISRNIPNAIKLLQRRLQLREQEEELESDNEYDVSGTEEPLQKSLVFNRQLGKRYTIHGVNDNEEEEENIETTDNTVTPSAPPKPVKRISRYNQSEDNSESAGTGAATGTTTPPTKHTTKRKFLTPLNRIRNPHLHNKPTFEKRLEQLRHSQNELSLQSQSQSEDGEQGQGAADCEQSQPIIEDVEVEATKTKSRLNSQLSPEELAEKAKISEDCIKQKLAEGQRPRLDISGMPRIPKIAPGDKPQVSLTARKSILDEPTTTSQKSDSTPGKPSGQRTLDSWLSTKRNSPETVTNRNSPGTSINETESQSQSQVKSGQTYNTRRSSHSRINQDDEVNHNRSPIPIDVDDDDNDNRSETSESSSARARIIESLKAKVAPPKDKFKPPNRSRHPRVAPPPPVEAFKPTIINDSDGDSDIEITEEKSNPGPTSYDLKKMEAIPKSSAFLSMIAGRSNRLLGLGSFKNERNSPRKSDAASAANADVVELSDSDEDEGAKVKGPSTSGGIGLTTTNSTADGRVKFPGAVPAAAPADDNPENSPQTSATKVLNLQTYPVRNRDTLNNEQEINRASTSTSASRSSSSISAVNGNEIGTRLKRKRFV